MNGICLAADESTEATGTRQVAPSPGPGHHSSQLPIIPLGCVHWPLSCAEPHAARAHGAVSRIDRKTTRPPQTEPLREPICALALVRVIGEVAMTVEIWRMLCCMIYTQLQ